MAVASLSVADEHLPALFRAADASSVTAQASHLRLIAINLTLLIAAAVVTSWAVATPELRTALAVTGAGILVAGLVLTGYIQQTKSGQQWYGGRAIAESVKTISWRYMTRSEPYGSTLSLRQVDDRFVHELSDILRVRSALGASLGGPAATTAQITPRMREIRSQDLGIRIGIYLRDRIQVQRDWYATKSKSNARYSNLWASAVGGSQLCAAIAAVALVRWPDFGFNVAAVMVAIAGAFIAFSQTKQNRNLAQAYGLAAHELGLIQVRADALSTEEDFAGFVADAESAISREHTLWVARRDIVTQP